MMPKFRVTIGSKSDTAELIEMNRLRRLETRLRRSKSSRSSNCKAEGMEMASTRVVFSLPTAAGIASKTCV
jgi:hypothetical protein